MNNIFESTINNVFCVYTEVMAQDDTFTFE